MLISTALAQGAQAADAPPNDQFGFILMMAAIFGIWFFLLIRPQQKKMKEHKEMVDGLRRGDRVVTGGGIFGTVAKVVSDEELIVEIAEGVRVRVERPSVTRVVAKTEPAARDSEGDRGGDRGGGDKGAGGSGGDAAGKGAAGASVGGPLGGLFGKLLGK